MKTKKTIKVALSTEKPPQSHATNESPTNGTAETNS